MEIINGKEIASEIRENLKEELAEKDLKPGLAIIMVGNNPASEIYVRNKRKACAEGTDVNFQLAKVFRPH